MKIALIYYAITTRSEDEGDGLRLSGRALLLAAAVVRPYPVSTLNASAVLACHQKLAVQTLNKAR